MTRDELIGRARAALAAVDPARLVREALGDPARLVREARGDGARSVRVLAVGKAAPAMTRGAIAALGERLEWALVVAPAADAMVAAVARDPRVQAMVGAHPRPDSRSLAAGEALLAAAASAPVEAEILALVSGGASALAAVPAAGLRLEDKVAVCEQVVRAGAPIAELNAVRAALSRIKGGRLAAAAVVPVRSLIISDVPGDDLAVIGSGPTVAGLGDPAAAIAILRRRGLWDQVPAPVRAALDDARAPALPAGRDRAELLAPRAAVADALLRAGARRGPGTLDDDVEAVAARLLAFVAGAGPGLWVWCGEPTVALPARSGQGGRAQHLALLLARGLATLARPVTLLVLATDGVDGNSDAAGAVVDAGTWQRAGRPEAALADFDTGPALAACGARVGGGPTGVNHADIVLAAVESPAGM